MLLWLVICVSTVLLALTGHISPLRFLLYCRQASLNEAAERQYERAAGLRPDVSTRAARPLDTHTRTSLFCKLNSQKAVCYTFTPTSCHGAAAPGTQGPTRPKEETLHPRWNHRHPAEGGGQRFMSPDVEFTYTVSG